MEELIIEPTPRTPVIHFTDGKLVIEGRSISEDPRNFYAPALLWTKQYIKQMPALTTVDIKLEYSDTKSIKMIFEFA